MTFKLSSRSVARLIGVHPDLVAVVNRAILITTVDFSVVEGVRSFAKQREYFIKGKSRTMNSRHLVSPNGFAHAVDLAPWIKGKIEWIDSYGFESVAVAMKQAAIDLELHPSALQWGYDMWAWDMPHFQLSRTRYPG